MPGARAGRSPGARRKDRPVIFKPDAIIWHLKPDAELKIRPAAPEGADPRPLVDGRPVGAGLERLIREDPPALPGSGAPESGAGAPGPGVRRLRPRRADLFVKLGSSCGYLGALLDFLNSRRLKIEPFDPRWEYLPSDLILCDDETPEHGLYLSLARGKRAVWEFLKAELGGRLG